MFFRFLCIWTFYRFAYFTYLNISHIRIWLCYILPIFVFWVFVIFMCDLTLTLLLLAAVFSISGFFALIDLYNLLHSLFFTHSLSMLSPECKKLCKVNNFLVLWSICLSYSLVHFKNGQEYFTTGTVQVYIPVMRFLLQSLVSRSFLILQRHSFLMFSLISVCLLVSVSNIYKFFKFSFSPKILLISWFGFSILSVASVFQLFVFSMAHFQCQIPFQYPDCIFLLFV